MKKHDFFVVCENINDPGNLGTIIRTAHGCGAAAVFLTKGSADVYNSKVLRSTMGSVFHIPIIIGMEIQDLISIFKENKINIISTYLEGSVDVFDANLKEKCALFIGNEARGASEYVIKNADCLVKIPMPGNAESFNASVAAGIVMYEAVRQRLKNN